MFTERMMERAGEDGESSSTDYEEAHNGKGQLYLIHRGVPLSDEEYDSTDDTGF